MSRPVIVLPRAEVDLARLEEFLASKSPRAANRAAIALAAAVDSLGESPERHPVLSRRGLRELPVKFDRDGYVIQYRVVGETVQVARIFHGRERR